MANKKKNKAGFPGEGSFVVNKKNGKASQESNYSNFTLNITPQEEDNGGVTLPDFATMSCFDLKNLIINFKRTLDTPSLVAPSQAWINTYTKAIADAEAMYASKNCDYNSSGTTGAPNGNLPDIGDINVKDTKTVTPLGVIKSNTPLAGAAVVSSSGTTVGTAVGIAVTTAEDITDKLKSLPWWAYVASAGLVYFIFFKGSNSTN